MENQEKVWNEIAEEWNKFRQKPLPEAMDFLGDKKGKVLDLGCGSGRNFIANKKIKFYCVDFSKEMIKFAKENAKKKGINVKFFISDSENLSFADNFFDSAIYIAALHCIPENRQRKKSLRELFRTLKKNSKALITVWSKNHIKLVNHTKDATITWKKDSERLQRYYYLYDKEELKELLENVGFKIISINDDGKNIVFIVKKP